MFAYFIRSPDGWRGPFWKPPFSIDRVVSIDVAPLVRETPYSRDQIGAVIRELLDAMPLMAMHEAVRRVCRHAAACNLPPDEVAHEAAKRMRAIEAGL